MCISFLCIKLKSSESIDDVLTKLSASRAVAVTRDLVLRIGCGTDLHSTSELVNQYGSLDAVMKEFSKNGGFLGVSGVSNDLRDVIAAADEGNERAKLAIDTFVDGIVGYVGMFTAFMGGLDEAKKAESKDGMISTPDSKVKVYVLKTNEELMVARKAIEFLSK